jgi:adenylate cyclase
MDDPLIEHMAEAIHLAWMAEKHRQGYADHPWPLDWRIGVDHACGLSATRHHPDMLPYADLAENVKAYDRVTARAALTAVMQAGYRLVRVAP